MSNGDRRRRSEIEFDVTADEIEGLVELRAVAVGRVELTLRLSAAEAEALAARIELAAGHLRHAADPD